MPPITGVHHLALTVRDLETSVRWYRDVLELLELFREEADERKACVMRHPAGFSVGLVQHASAETDRFDPRRLGLDHAAFTVATREDLEGWARRLSELGVTHSGVIDVPPGAILNFKDPDEIGLALFWDRD